MSEHVGADLAAIEPALAVENGVATAGADYHPAYVEARLTRPTLAKALAERDGALALVGQLQGQLDAVQAIVDESGGLLHDEGFGYVVRDLDAALAAAVLSDREGTQ